jgi:hypothetical protein
MIVYYLSFSDRPDVVFQNGSMMNILENKQVTWHQLSARRQ